MALEYLLRTATGLLMDLEMTNLCGLEIGAEMSDITLCTATIKINLRSNK